MAWKVAKEFREFAMKGSVVDLAVGIIIGTAFGAIVRSLVDDVIMPLAGVLLGGLDYSQRYVVIKGNDGNATTVAAAREAGAVVVAYGNLVNTIITFILVAWAVFLLVRGINRMRRRRQEEPTATTRPCPECTTAIPKAAKRCPACTAPIEAQPSLPPA